MAKINILSNPAMPGLIMLSADGVQDEPSRLSPGVPELFVIEFSIETGDIEKISAEFRKIFSSQQPNRERDFFEISLETATAKLRALKQEEDELRRQAVAKAHNIELNRKPSYSQPRTFEEMVASARGQSFRQANKNKTIMDNEKFKTALGWTVAIFLILFVMFLGASDDGGRGTDLYENSRQIRR